MAGEVAEPRPGRWRGTVEARLTRAGASALSGSRPWLAEAIAPVGAGLIALALIVPTVLPDVATWDTAEFQTVLPTMGVAHPTGFPAYVLLGWLASIVLAPVGSAAYRVDLLQAILAAVCVGATVTIVRQLGAPRVVAFAAGLAMATTVLFWRLSTHSDPHMFHATLVAILFAVLLRWETLRRSADEANRATADRWLVAAALVYAVAVANHSLALLLAPGIALFVLLTEPRILLRWRIVATCVVLFVAVAAGLFMELPIRAAMHAPLVYGHPDTWNGFWYDVLGQQFGGSFSQPFANLGTKTWGVLGVFTRQIGFLLYLLPLGYFAALRRDWQTGVVAGCVALSGLLLIAPTKSSAAIAAHDITPFCLAFGLAMVLSIRPRYAVLSGAAFVIACWFAMSYANADIERYYLAPLVIAFTWIGLAAAEIVAAAASLAVVPDWTAIAARSPRRIADWSDGFGASGALRTRLESRAIGAERTVEPPDRHVPDENERRRSRRRRKRESAAILAVAYPLMAVLLVGPQLGVIADRYRPPAGAQGPGVNESARTGDRAWLDQVMAQLPRNAVIVSWWDASTTLWYGQLVEHSRPDLLISDDRTRLDAPPFSDDVLVGIDFYLRQGRQVFVIKPDKVALVSARYQVKPWIQGTVLEILGPK